MPASRRRRRIVVGALTLALAATAVPPAHAVIDEYKRKDFPVGQELRTWGYLHDHCLSLTVACNVGGGADGVLRPEATAQSIAIWVLAALRLDLQTSTSKGFNNVDWEVGPRRPPPNPPDTPLADAPAEPPGEPADPCDPAAPGGSEPGDKWRIDILTDRNRHIEVKSWDKRTMVDNQLTCYVDRAGENGLVIPGPQDQLNTVRFAVPFVDNTGQVWCTWAPVPGPPGHVYFAQMNATPADAALRCGGAALAAARVVLTMKEKVKEIMNRERPEVNADDLLKDKMLPAVIPSYRRIPRSSTTTYVISAPQRPDTRMDLVFDFGDSTSSVLNVPAGTGVVNFSLTKSFPTTGRFTQKAKLARPNVVLAQPGAAAQSADQTWIPLEYEATTDVVATC